MTSAHQSSFASPSVEVFLPHEMLKEIFSHCSPSTLFNVSFASLACLELSSEYLYGDIVLSDADKVFNLFCSRSSQDLPTSPRVSPHTSSSLIRTFTFFHKEDIDFVLPTALGLGPRVRPLPIDILTISLPPRTRSSSLRMDSLLDLFNPGIFILRGRLPDPGSNLPFLGCPSLRIDDSPGLLVEEEEQPRWSGPSWSRLTHIITSNAVPGGSNFSPYLSSIHNSVCSFRGPVLTFIYDFCDLPPLEPRAVEEMENEFVVDVFYGTFRHEDRTGEFKDYCNFRAWVPSEQLKERLIKSLGEDGGDLREDRREEKYLGRTAFFEVKPSCAGLRDAWEECAGKHLASRLLAEL